MGNPNPTKSQEPQTLTERESTLGPLPITLAQPGLIPAKSPTDCG